MEMCFGALSLLLFTVVDDNLLGLCVIVFSILSVFPVRGCCQNNMCLSLLPE